MDQREHNNGMSNLDALDTDGGDVAALLRALPRVEAPNNFAFRVKASIAEGSAPRAGLIKILKVAAPLTLVLLVAVALLFSGVMDRLNSPSVAEVPQASQFGGNLATAVPVEVQRETSGPQVTELAAPREALPAQRNTNTVRNNVRPKLDPRGGSIDIPLGGGSREDALRSANTILPPGFESINPGARNLNSNSNMAAADVSVRSVLGILGITADFADGGWKVQSVAENSVGARSSVRQGDVIEAMDGQQVTSDSVFKGSAKTLTIRRDGKTINVNVKN